MKRMALANYALGQLGYSIRPVSKGLLGVVCYT